MQKTLGENITHVVIVQRVIQHLAVPAVFDQPGLPEYPELMGNSGLGHAEQGGYITDAHVGMLQGAENLHPRRVAEYLEQVRQIQKDFLLRHLLADFLHDFLMDDLTIAFVYFNGEYAHNGPPQKND
jgi:hypothetical protein